MAEARDESAASSLRIVMQYFRGDTLVCEFKRADVSLSLHVARSNARETQDGGWRIEAHAKRADGDVVVAGAGTTRREALAALSASWVEQTTAQGLAPVDWDAVAVALKSVRAMD